MADRNRDDEPRSERRNEAITGSDAGMHPERAGTESESADMARGPDRAGDQGLGSSATKEGIDGSNRETGGEERMQADRAGTDAGMGAMDAGAGGAAGGYGMDSGFSDTGANESGARERPDDRGGESGRGTREGMR